MKIIYDISVLGLGQLHNRARTGVYRVIEDVAAELIGLPNCMLSFCDVSNDISNIVQSERYVENSNVFSSNPFLSPPLLGLQNYLLLKNRFLKKRLEGGESKSTWDELNTNFQLRLFLRAERALRYSPDYLVKDRLFKNADIFHSPFYKVPDHILAIKGKTIFVTSYDLIPILFPQYFEEDASHLIGSLLDSITRDTWVLCISNSTRNDLLNYLGDKVDPAKVIVTHLAASALFYPNKDTEFKRQIKEKYKIPTDMPYLLSLCTLEPRKNIEQVIKAFVEICEVEGITDLQLVLVGTKGWKFEKIFETLDYAKEFHDRIIITGYVNDGHLSAIYSDALAFIYPSFYEGFGLPPLEAMQCGVPVITSNTSSLPEVIGNAGIMVEPKDTDALCQAILDIYNSQTLRAKMSLAGIDRARQFSWKKCASLTADAYRASLGQ